MKKWLVLLLLAISFVLVGCQHGPAVHTSDGRKISLARLQGKWLVLVYWSSWSDACKENMPQFNAFYQSLDQSTTMLGFDNLLLPHETLKQAIAKVKVAFPVIRENVSAYYHLPLIEIEPTLFVINPEGRLVKTLHGMILATQLKATLAQLQRLASLVKTPLPLAPSSKRQMTTKANVGHAQHAKKVITQLV